MKHFSYFTIANSIFILVFNLFNTFGIAFLYNRNAVSYTHLDVYKRQGYASYQIDIGNNKLDSSSQFCDILVCSSRRSIYQYLRDLRPHGLLIHTLTAVSFKTEDQEFISQNSIQVKYVDALTLAKQEDGNALMSNMILLGALSEIIGLDLAAVEHIVSDQFADKPKLLEIDLDVYKRQIQ